MAYSKRKSTNPWFAVVFGVVFIIIFMVGYFSAWSRERTCSEIVYAKVYDVTSRMVKETTGGKYRHTRMVEKYTAHFTYEYNGNTFNGDSNDTKDSSRYKIGDQLLIRVNPDEPYDYYQPINKSGYIVMILFAAAFTAIWYYLRIHNRMKSDKEIEEWERTEYI